MQSRRPTAQLTPDPVIVARQAADTQHIRGYGVPTPPDDTIGTRYGKHQGPARILPAPPCRPQGPALCLVDTATVFRSGEYEGEGDGGGIPDERITNWLVFAADQDSAQIFVISRQFASLWMSPASAEGFFIEHAINDASWIRARFGHAGTYIFSARISADDPIPYELRVAPVIATGASWPIGQSATLTIHADTSVAIVPAAMAAGLNADSTWARFAVWPREYRALLVRDTMYVACKLPCTQPQRFTMRPAQRVEINP